VHDYVATFIAYVLHVGITSKLHQVHPFVTGLEDLLQEVVDQHHPRGMEVAIILTRTLESPTPTTPDAIGDSSNNDDMKHPAEHDDHAPSSKMVGDSTTTTTTATPTPYNTPATAQLPQVGYSTATNVCIANIKHLHEDLDNDIAAEAQYAKSGLLFANEDHTPAPPPPTMTPSLLLATPDLDDFVDPATLTQLH
jgi:hypothetical protein